jgi:uncharacterized protein (TIGR02271 family)
VLTGNTLKMDEKPTLHASTTLPVLEEVATISKQTVPTGHVRLEKTVDIHTQTISEPLRREEAVVERVTVGTVVDPVSPPQVRIENGVTIVPVLEEILFIEKRLILKEELHIRHSVSEVVETHDIPLKKEQVIVNRSEVSKAPLSAATPPDQKSEP